MGINLPFVQSKIANYALSALRNQYGLDVEIESFRASFLNRASVTGLMIYDDKGDTLLFTQRAEISLSAWSLSKGFVEVSSIGLSQPFVNIYKDSGDSLFNIEPVIAKFEQPKKTDSKPINLSIDQVAMLDARIHFRDDADTILPKLRLVELNTEVRDISLNEEIVLQLNRLDFKEKEQGFALNKFTAGIEINNEGIALRDFLLETNQSEIELEAKLEQYRPKATSVLSRYRGTINLQSLVVNSAEFRPYIKQIPLDEEIQISGKVEGNIDDFRSNNLKVEIGHSSRFSGDVHLIHALDLEKARIDARVYGMVLNQSDYPKWFEALTDKPLPKNFDGLGNLVFEGSLKGDAKNIRSDGALSTNYGKVDMNLGFQYDSLVIEGSYSGELALENIELGQILKNDKLGQLSMYTEINGKGLSLDKFDADLQGEIYALGFNGYSYKNIDLEGNLADRKFIGQVLIDEPNLEFEFNGSVDFSGNQPIMDAEAFIDYADLYALNLYTKDSIANLSLGLDMDFTGGTLNELTGNITVSNTTLETTRNYYYFSDLVVDADRKGTYRTLNITSDMATAKVEGIYDFTGLAKAGQNMVARYFSKVETQRVNGLQQFALEADIINITPITDIFAPDLTVEPGAKVNGYFSTATNELRLDVDFPGIRYKTYKLRRLDLKTRQEGRDLMAEARVDQVFINKKLQLDTVTIINRLKRDTAEFQISVSLDDYVQSVTRVNGYVTVPKKEQIALHFYRSESKINEQIWEIAGGSDVLYQADSIIISQFAMTSGKSEIKLDGVVGPDYEDRLRVDLDSVNLDIARPYLLASGTDLRGWADINGGIRGVTGNMIADLVVKIDSVQLNKEKLGDLNLITQWDAGNQKVNIDGALLNRNVENLAVHGTYAPLSPGESLNLKVNINNFKLKSISNYLKEIADPLYGKAYGEILVRGEPRSPILQGDLKFQKANFRLPLLNVQYNIDGEAILHLENNYLEFRQFNLRDPNSGLAKLSGRVYHERLKDIRLDLQIQTDSLLCLNTGPGYSDLYYGKAVATGNISVKGPVNDIYMGIAAKANKGTKFSIPLTGFSKVGEQEYIRFVSSMDSNETEVVEKDEYQADLDGITLDFQLEVTPESEVEIIFDEKVGDIMRGRGYANLQLEITSLGDFNMYGDYTVTEGDYLFTLENLINKRFEVEPGGSISWNGDPYKAQLDLTAEYQTRTSLYNLQLASDTSRVKRDVVLELHVTGNLLQPEIEFDIDAPNAPDQVQNELDERLKNQNEMNTQVIALLVLNSFINSGSGAGNYLAQAGQGVQTNTYELLSNQVSQMISQWSDRFDVGLNYRAGNEKQLTTQELEVALSTQLFDDRVSVNSNLGVPLEESDNTSNLVGDVSVEVYVTQDGRIRAKAFNRSNEYDPTKEQINYTQGVGLFYSEEFDTLDELIKRIKARRNKRKKAKEEETKNPSD